VCSPTVLLIHDGTTTTDAVAALTAVGFTTVTVSTDPFWLFDGVKNPLTGFGAVVILPFRTGEIVRPALIHKKGEISGWTATGTIGAERIIDGLILSLIVLVTLRFVEPRTPMPDHIGDLPVPVAAIPVAATSAAVLFSAAFGVMTIFYLRREWAKRILELFVGRLSPGLSALASKALESFAHGLGFLARPGRALPFLGVTLLQWALNAFGIWIVAHGCGMEALTFPQALVALGVQGLGSILPNAPGFFGAFQISMYAAFSLYFDPAVVVDRGATVVFVLYVLNIGIILIAAACALLLNREKVLLARA